MTEVEPQKKSRRNYGWVIGFLGAFAVGFGLYSTNSNKGPAPGAIQDKAVTTRARELQKQLAQIQQRPVANIGDYIRNTVDAAPIIDEAKGLLPLQIASVEQFKQQHTSNDKDVMVAGYAVRMFQKDQELMSLMSDEIYCARALEALPDAKQAAYYKDNVLPLKAKEQEAFKEWAAIAKEAADKGASWSDAVTSATKLAQ